MSRVDWSKTCIACQNCCTYVSLEIDAPRGERDFDSIRWYLAHKRIHIYLDREGSWYFLVNSECENLTPAGCAIYEKRFNICRDYAASTCEMTLGEAAEKHLFRTVEDFDRWLAFHRERLLQPVRVSPGRATTAELDAPPPGANPLVAGPMARRRRSSTPPPLSGVTG